MLPHFRAGSSLAAIKAQTRPAPTTGPCGRCLLGWTLVPSSERPGSPRCPSPSGLRDLSPSWPWRAEALEQAYAEAHVLPLCPSLWSHPTSSGTLTGRGLGSGNRGQPWVSVMRGPAWDRAGELWLPSWLFLVYTGNVPNLTGNLDGRCWHILRTTVGDNFAWP